MYIVVKCSIEQMIYLKILKTFQSIDSSQSQKVSEMEIILHDFIYYKIDTYSVMIGFHSYVLSYIDR
jgi:hypothetical protein